MYKTKNGKHGTLYLYRFSYISTDECEPKSTVVAWGYNAEDAEERLIDNLDAQGFEYIKDYELRGPSRVKN